jgi:hypothetical protein
VKQLLNALSFYLDKPDQIEIKLTKKNIIKHGPNYGDINNCVISQVICEMFGVNNRDNIIVGGTTVTIDFESYRILNNQALLADMSYNIVEPKTIKIILKKF